jgi:cell division protein FtsL
MSVFGVFDRRFRGFRVVEIGGVGVLLALALIVYLAKTGAGDERADIDRVQQQISDEQAKVALLRAEVASLEQPERLEALSNRYLGLQPIPAAHEVDPTALAAIAHPPPPQPKTSTTAVANPAAKDDSAKAPKTNAAPADPIGQLVQASPAAEPDSAAPPAQTAESPQ